MNIKRPNYKWTKWFAWHPVKTINNEWIWLNYCERKIEEAKIPNVIPSSWIIYKLKKTSKEFEITELKNEYFFKWLKEEDLKEFGNRFQYDEGQVEGVKDFLEFIENEYNKKAIKKLKEDDEK